MSKYGELCVLTIRKVTLQIENKIVRWNWKARNTGKCQNETWELPVGRGSHPVQANKVEALCRVVIGITNSNIVLNS